MTPPVRVLYLAGSGRSGSTLVTNLLGQYDGFFAAGELRYLWQRGQRENRPCGCGRPFRECPLWQSVVTDLPMERAAGIAGGLRRRLRMRGLPGLLRRAGRGGPSGGSGRSGPVVAADPAADPVLAGLYAAVAARTGASIVVDSSKLPPYGALLGGLPGIELRVLHLVRDPRATAFSWRRRRGLDGAADQRLMSRPPVAKAALLWLVWNAATVRLWGGSAERYLRIRYEELAAAPEPTLRRIVEFATAPSRGDGATGPDRPTGPSPFVDPVTVRLAPTHSVAGNPSRHRSGLVAVTADDEWRQRLPRWSYALVTAITVTGLRRFGYPLGRPRADATGPVGADASGVGADASRAGAGSRKEEE